MNKDAYYAEADFAAMLRDLVRARFYMLAGALAGLGMGLLLLVLAVPQYRAVMIVGPVQATGKATLDDPDDAADPLDFARFESVLRGPAVAAALTGHDGENFGAGLATARRWRFGAGPVDGNHTDKEKYADIATHLAARVRIAPVGATTLRRVSYDHPDPDFAVAMLAALHEAADHLLREDARRQGDARAAQLRESLARTDNPDHRRVLTTALVGQEQDNMLRSLAQPYAAQIVEPPAAMRRPQWPRPLLFIPVFIGLGLFCGFMAHAVRRSAS